MSALRSKASKGPEAVSLPKQHRRASDARSAQKSELEHLFLLEGEIRQRNSPTELRFHLLNESRRLLGFRQAFYIDLQNAPKVTGVSSLATIEDNAPLVRWISSLYSAFAKDQDQQAPCLFDLPAYGDADLEFAAEYPFRHFVWIPLKARDGVVFAGVLFAKEGLWQKSEVELANYLGGVYAHAFSLFEKRQSRLKAGRSKAALLTMVLVALAALLFVEVPMTTLAPAEIVADKPYVVAAPLSGAIDQIVVPPNELVEAGSKLVEFNDVELRNQFEVAERELAVARALERKTSQSALIDRSGRRDLALAKTELELKQAERDYAFEMLQRTEVRAERAGMVVYSDPDSWIGRPVNIGERILELVDPANVKIRIEVPVHDSISLREGAEVRLFLDADPLNWRDATITYASTHAKPVASGELAYTVEAILIEPDPAMRIGYRGTAQLFAEQVPLYFFLFRRPISALRQSLGL